MVCYPIRGKAGLSRWRANSPSSHRSDLFPRCVLGWWHWRVAIAWGQVPQSSPEGPWKKRLGGHGLRRPHTASSLRWRCSRQTPHTGWRKEGCRTELCAPKVQLSSQGAGGWRQHMGLSILLTEISKQISQPKRGPALLRLFTRDTLRYGVLSALAETLFLSSSSPGTHPH